MKKVCVCLLMLGMLVLSACSFGEEDLQMVSLEGIENVRIDHRSTTVHVESADIEELEAAMMYSFGSGIVIDKRKQRVDIRLKSDNMRIFKLGKQPRLVVRVPTDYKGSVTINGNSGNVNVSNLQAQSVDIQGNSGNVSLDYARINSDVNVSVNSGNVVLNLEDKEPDIRWLLESGSGRRSIALPLNNSRQSGKKTQGQTGDGSFQVRIRTTSGSITVKND
ncbi:DUF4097 family beta strand repeat-containing protein [Paenibacillus sp. MSJ-34]|uniref:DUF4097 family beta strand repeat-containing protein n=1 Tax=Paenibacillus sp. MSJ-34 TaxID=2841529 RepID=UPI001C121BFB|nr:DUF4097 family beta strand repeat-containing protein [Paenibacillus sp. MSJ-34]MBU5443507.1 DUF4097 domain-containing protein [Paenibacillus sp. MSJ-34]